MAYTLTQARGLLTQAELELFDQSRAEPVKALTAARLRGKLARARKLRDKYRDLYRRQSVATRKAPVERRSGAGVDNERTQRKAVVFEEVLGRFEARLQLLDARAAREAARKPAAVKRATSARKNAAGAARPTSIKKAVKRAVKLKSKEPKFPLADLHSTQVPSVTAPLDVTAKTERLNPLKKKAGNVAIHAHASARGRRGQARRDSR
ncbi:MAG: hypothetical protein ABIP61_08630 [Burkholderiaceae bacterium]